MALKLGLLMLLFGFDYGIGNILTLHPQGFSVELQLTRTSVFEFGQLGVS
jgi:hypothetical protein